MICFSDRPQHISARNLKGVSHMFMCFSLLLLVQHFLSLSFSSLLPYSIPTLSSVDLKKEC